MGFLVGIGLLSYSGKMPVNVIYYILIVVAVPVISIILSTVAIFTKSNTISNFITLLFPLHWVETISRNLPFKQKIDSLELPFSKKFSKILFIKKIQLFSLIFSIGIFLALIILVISKDIAIWMDNKHRYLIAQHFYYHFLSTNWEVGGGRRILAHSGLFPFH